MLKIHQREWRCEDVSVLDRFIHLRELTLAEMECPPNSILNVSNMTFLEELYVRDCNMSGIHGLEHTRRLRVLHLHASFVRYQGSTLLSQVVSPLEKLYLSRVDLPGLLSLSSFTKLETVDVTDIKGLHTLDLNHLDELKRVEACMCSDLHTILYKNVSYSYNIDTDGPHFNLHCNA